MSTSSKAIQWQTMLRSGFVVALFILMATLMGYTKVANAQAPNAGAVIGNQATATYNDGGGAPRNATSNEVQTVVQQVRSFTLTAPGFRTAAPSDTVTYPHTITNTGNGTDTYSLIAPTTGGAFTHTGLAYYRDADCNGIADNAVAITSTGPLARNTSFCFVVSGTVPAAATLGQTGTITVSVTDNAGAGTNATNLDTTTVSNSAIVMNKVLSSTPPPAVTTVTGGASPNAGPLYMILNYTNTGTAPAANLVITDNLSTRTGLTYVAASGRWSVSGAATALGDGAGGDPVGINYQTAGSVTNPTITATVASVPAGQSGFVYFQVTVNANLAPTNAGNQALTSNNASYVTDTQTTPNVTNTVTYSVGQTAAVVANGSQTDSADGIDEPVTIASASAGSTINFNNIIWNRGNGTDTFDINITTNSFPGGSTVSLLQSDGATSLLNSSGSGAPDTGPIPGRNSTCPPPLVTHTVSVVPLERYCGYIVVARVTLPSTATAGPFSITKRATSVFDGGQFNDVVDTLTVVTPNTVDLTNNTARADSTPPGAANAANAATTGFGTTATVITTNTITPNDSTPTVTRFTLFVNNTSAVTDSYNLTVGAVPVGWTMQYRAAVAGGCVTVGAVVTSVGPLTAGSNTAVCAEVTIPVTTSGNAAPGTFNFDFTATSNTNNTVTDVKRDAVVVNQFRRVVMTPNNTQQTFPGGVVVYTHTISNTGNVVEPISFATGTCLADTRLSLNWSSSAYLESGGGAGLQLGTDTLIASTTPPATVSCPGAAVFTLAVGETRTIYVRVQANTPDRDADPDNVTTLTATYAGASTTSVTNTTGVSDGLLLTKEQVLVGCSTTATHTGYSTALIPAGAGTAPGQCIAYRIVATNTTAGSVTNVVLSDVIPANTTIRYLCSGNNVANPNYQIGAGAAVNLATPTDGAAGTLTTGAGFTLTPSQTATLYFCVRINS